MSYSGIYRNTIYKHLENVGGPLRKEDPLRTCLGIDFQANGTIKRHSKECQNLLADYCAENWDNICEFSSDNEKVGLPNMASLVDNSHSIDPHLTQGIYLVRNAAQRKYAVSTLSRIGDYIKTQRFNPVDTTNTSRIAYFNMNPIDLVYDVNPHTIDNDPIMNKMLNEPKYYMDILRGIYITRVNNQTLHQLKSTRLGMFLYANGRWFG